MQIFFTGKTPDSLCLVGCTTAMTVQRKRKCHVYSTFVNCFTLFTYSLTVYTIKYTGISLLKSTLCTCLFRSVPINANALLLCRRHSLFLALASPVQQISLRMRLYLQGHSEVEPTAKTRKSEAGATSLNFVCALIPPQCAAL